MLIQLTDAGVAIMNAATSPVVLTSYKLGSSYGYTPTSTQSNIVGTLITTGVPSAPVVETANEVKYTIVLGDSAGPYTFGEVVFYKDATAFAVGVFDATLTKTPLDPSAHTGGAMVLDFYLEMVGSNYQMWANSAQSNTLKISTLNGPEALPQPINATPNSYVVSSPSLYADSYLAFTDRAGKWNFGAYATLVQATVVSATSLTITVLTSEVAGVNTLYLGSRLLQVISGSLFGTCRYVTSIDVIDGTHSQLTLNAPLATLPLVGDQIEIDGRLSSLATTAPATNASLGLVKIGPSLTVDYAGLINTNQTTIITDLAGNPLGALVAVQA